MTRCGLALLSYSSLKCSLEESMSVITMIRGDGDSRTRFPGLFGGILWCCTRFRCSVWGEFVCTISAFVCLQSSLCFSIIHISIWLRSFCRCKFLHHFIVVSLTWVLDHDWAKDKPRQWQSIVPRSHMKAVLSNSHHSYILIRTQCVLTVLHSYMMVTRLKMKDAVSCTRPQAT